MSLWSRLFGRHLFLTNTITCGGFLFVGDMIQQRIELKWEIHPVGCYDWGRSGRMFLVGLSQGPQQHFFYKWLDKILPQKRAKTVMKKILIDQIIAAPCSGLTFFMTAGILEGNGFHGSLQEFKKKYPSVYLCDWLFWPPSQAINFNYIPAQYRVLYINVMTVIWDIFLSYTKHYDQTNKDKQKKVLSNPEMESLK